MPLDDDSPPMRPFTASHERAWNPGDIDFSRERPTGRPSPTTNAGCCCGWSRASASASAASAGRRVGPQAGDASGGRDRGILPPLAAVRYA